MSKRQIGDIQNLGRTRKYQVLKNLEKCASRFRYPVDEVLQGEKFSDEDESGKKEFSGRESCSSDSSPSSPTEPIRDPEQTRVAEQPRGAGASREMEVGDTGEDDLGTENDGYNSENENDSDDETDMTEASNEEDNGTFNEDDEIGNEILELQQGLIDGDRPVYEGAPITAVESLLAVLTMVTVFNLTGTCLAALLTLIQLHCKKPSLLRHTLYRFRKCFEQIKSPIVRHYYCSQCLMYLESKESPCQCENRPNSAFFIEIPIAHQLKSLFTRKGFYEDLNYRFTLGDFGDFIRDIYDGSLYRKLFKRGRFLIERNNISFSWYSDGVPVFKSRKFSLWPIYLIINELPYGKRVLKQNIIVAGLWFGPTDPIANLFLKPIHSQFETLCSEGVKVRSPDCPNNITVKAMLLQGMGDTPARGDFLCHTRLNGEYGCTVCYAKGKSICGEKSGHTRVYPFEDNVVLRTQKETDQHAEEAMRSGKSVFGVKAPALLSKTMPDATKGVCIDVMHCVFLGITKRLLTLWFDSCNRFKDFSLHRFLNVIDSRFVNLKPPNYVNRPPRSIEQHAAFFKAMEYKYWFFIYSVILLADVMDPAYFEHYMKFVLGVYLLCTDTVSRTSLAASQKLLEEFISKFEELYGERNMTFNLHLLRHLPRTAYNSGPLWVTTCFPFEDLNGQLVKKIHGTTHVGLQVYSAVAHSVILPYLVSQLPDSDAKEYCLNLMDSHAKEAKQLLFGKTYLVGNAVKYEGNVTPDVRAALESSAELNTKTRVFFRLRRGSHLFSCSSYKQSKNHINYCVKVVDDAQREHFGIVKIFVRTCPCNSQGDCRADCSPSYYALFEKGTVQPFSATRTDLLLYLYSFAAGTVSSLVPLHYLKYVCFMLEVNNKTYVSEPVNMRERE